MTSRRIFRAVALVVVLAVLLLLYRIHPIAGWATLTTLAIVTVAARRRKLKTVVAD